jgi:hypothetical protein
MRDNNPDQIELYADSNRGVYIPQFFAQTVRRDLLTGVNADELAVLEAGPDHEDYWDTWNDVLNNAQLAHPLWGECYLYQNGDLWVMPFASDEEILAGA